MKNRILIFFLLAALILCCACSAPMPAPAQEAPAEPQPAEPAVPESPYTEGTYHGRTRESYLAIAPNAEISAREAPLTAFSLKVDTAAYTNVQRYIQSGSLPPADAVRTEEMVNYFRYDAPLDFAEGAPLALHAEVAPSPLNPGRYLAMIRVKAREASTAALPPSNLNFLIDTSGSMESYDKLPLLQDAFSLLAETLGADDRVSLVAYAGYSAVLLDSVPGNESERILGAIRSLHAGGPTAGAAGIEAAYALAAKNFIEDGNNRVILATDGDFNVGIDSVEALGKFIAEKRESGLYLSVLGFGAGNLRDDVMETLAANGNGNYSYINSLQTARKVLVEEMGSNLFTIAEDARAQVAFNPEIVKSYRLIGYENRRMSAEEFEGDDTDAGELGLGADIAVLFELELHDAPGAAIPEELSPQDAATGLLFEVRARYKNPGEAESRLLTLPAALADMREEGGSDFLFAASVAAFAERLRGAAHASLSPREILALAEESLGEDIGGYREAHLELLRRYIDLAY